MRFALRLEPGEDLRGRLEALTRERGWDAAFVIAGIGSLRVAALRRAEGQSAEVVAKARAKGLQRGHPTMSFGDALREVWRQDPELLDRHQRERRVTRVGSARPAPRAARA